jgi:hypothetical protein
MPDEPNRTTPPAPPTASPVRGDSGSVLPRAALERVLARATELQASGAETPETISEARLLEIGREVGIDPNHLRMAIAEERGRSPMLPDTPGRIEQALGEAHTGTQRAVPGTPDTVLASLDRWLQREEQLVVKRRFGQRMSWERARREDASSKLRGDGRRTREHAPRASARRRCSSLEHAAGHEQALHLARA